MSVKTFTSGEVLIASDTNTYLNNGGLVYIKETVQTSGVATLTITSAFSSTYRDYLVTLSNFNATVALSNIRLQVGSVTSGVYYGGLYGYQYDGATASAFNNGSAFANVGRTGASTNAYATINIANPFVAANTMVQSGWAASGQFGFAGCDVQSATSQTDFTLTLSSGSFSGTITVYGYRKA